MRVLSLFDGISCGQLALRKAGIAVSKYYASEIDKHAIAVTNKNFPETVQLGDVLGWRDWDIEWGKIALLIGGSPCCGFSVAGKKLNFEDERSKLFFVYRDILEHIRENNPKVQFLLENVRMAKDVADVIDRELGVKRLYIDSRNFTGHIRKRYYWASFPIPAVKEKDIKLRDILEDGIPYDRSLESILERSDYSPSESYDGIITINPRDKKGKQTWQRGRVYDIKGNCPTICASLFDLNITEDHKMYRKLTVNECERLQGVPIDYTKGIPKTERGKCLGNGWTVDVIAHILEGLKG